MNNGKARKPSIFQMLPTQVINSIEQEFSDTSSSSYGAYTPYTMGTESETNKN
jgi:hypothetical protein